MLLHNLADKINFLNECYLNIHRILKSEPVRPEDSKTDAMPTVRNEDKVALDSDLPKFIRLCRQDKNSLTLCKLQVMIDLYNEVAQSVTVIKPLDLDTIFAEIKYRHQDLFNSLNCPDLNTGMRKHRYAGFTSWLANPASTTFLEKYNFFRVDAKKTEATALYR